MPVLWPHDPSIVTTRPYRPTDAPVIQSLIATSTFPYPSLDDPLIELITVVTDDTDAPIGAFIAIRRIEAYIVLDDMHPAARLAVVRTLHEDVPPLLKSKGYNAIEAYLQPQVAMAFGR